MLLPNLGITMLSAAHIRKRLAGFKGLWPWSWFILQQANCNEPYVCTWACHVHIRDTDGVEIALLAYLDRPSSFPDQSTIAKLIENHRRGVVDRICRAGLLGMVQAQAPGGSWQDGCSPRGACGGVPTFRESRTLPEAGAAALLRHAHSCSAPQMYTCPPAICTERGCQLSMKGHKDCN